MDSILTSMGENPGLTWGLGIGSVVMFVGSLAAIQWLVARAPEDFFVREKPEERSGKSWALKILKNVVGLAALVLGVLMLFLPGQGLLMVVLGISLLDFPGKRKVQTWLVRKQSVQKGLQYLRRRAHKPPFKLP